MSNAEDDMKWIDEYPTLKQVNPANPFAVPSNYFEGMEQQLMGIVNLPQPNANGFTLPDDYFNQLTQNIQNRIALEQATPAEEQFAVPDNYFNELQQNIMARIAIDEALNTDKGFTVPDNYFDELEQNIMARVAIDQALNTGNSFTVPDKYFDELEQNITARITVEEALNTKQGFTIPDGYFAQLENKILQQTTLTQTGTPAPQQRQGIVVKLLVSKAFKYASAACFALVVGVAVFMSEFNPTAQHNRSYLHKQLSKIPTDELESYLELNGDTPSILENVDADNFDTEAISTNAQQKGN